MHQNLFTYKENEVMKISEKQIELENIYQDNLAAGHGGTRL